MKNKIDNYTFDASAKTITFTDYTTIRLDGILLITNVTDNVIIYNFADPTKGGSVLTNVLTLAYNTTTMDDGDKLLIYYDDVIDGKVLYVGNVTSTSAGTAIDTQGYGSIVAQFSGVWNATIYFETSNDGTIWNTCFVLSRNEVSMQDNIGQNGIFSIKRSGRYLRYNCKFTSGTVSLNIIGRTGEGLSDADMLSFAMDRTHNTPLQVQLPKDLKQEADGGLLLADMKGPIFFNSVTVSQPLVIDCTGYSTLIVQKLTSGIVTPTASNDGSTFVGTLSGAIGGPNTVLGTTIPTATGIYVIPVYSRYIKLTGPASSVQCVIYLSKNIFDTGSFFAYQGLNVIQLNGTNIQAVGSTTATVPLPIGSVDDLKAPITRRYLIDTLGKQIIATNTGQVSGTASSKTLNELGFLSDYKNNLTVQDVSRSDGNSNIDLLSGILLELQVLNQQIYELPRLIASGRASLDEPDDLRNDLTLFDRY